MNQIRYFTVYRVCFLLLIAFSILTSGGCSRNSLQKSTLNTTGNTVSDTDNKNENKVSEGPVAESKDEIGTIADTENNINAKYKKDIEAYLDKNDFYGTILIKKDDEILIEEGFGYADIQSEKANKTETIYEIGSLTKQFTAAAVMKLAEEGKISVEDTLDKYLPEYSMAGQITIKQLLNMTSGIVDYMMLPYDTEYLQKFAGIANEEESFHKRISKEIKTEDILDYIDGQELRFQPGTKYEYSNTNYYFLGMVIEKITGMSYEEYMKENIFEPLNMSSTSCDPLSTTATGYIDQNGKLSPIMSSHYTLSFSAGSICSNVEDMLKWESAVISGQLLSDESWSEILDGGKHNYGYGWGVYGNMYAHSGNTFGFNSSVIIVPKDKLIIIALSNTSGSNAAKISNVIRNLIR